MLAATANAHGHVGGGGEHGLYVKKESNVRLSGEMVRVTVLRLATLA